MQAKIALLFLLGWVVQPCFAMKHGIEEQLSSKEESVAKRQKKRMLTPAVSPLEVPSLKKLASAAALNSLSAQEIDALPSYLSLQILRAFIEKNMFCFYGVASKDPHYSLRLGMLYPAPTETYVELCPDGKRIAHGSSQDLYLYDVSTQPNTGIALQKELSAQLRCVRFSKNGSVVVAGYTDGSACLWNLAASPDLTASTLVCNRVNVPVFVAKEPVYNVAVSNDGKRLIVMYQCHAVVHELNPEDIKSHILSDAEISSESYIPDPGVLEMSGTGKYAVMVYVKKDRTRSQTIIWDLDELTVAKRAENKGNDINHSSASLSAHCNHAVVRSEDNLNSLLTYFDMTRHPIDQVSPSAESGPDEAIAVAVANTGLLAFADTNGFSTSFVGQHKMQYEPLWILMSIGHDVDGKDYTLRRPQCIDILRLGKSRIAVDAAGRYAFFNKKSKIYVADLKSRKVIILNKPDDQPNWNSLSDTLKVSPDGRHLLASIGGFVFYWDLLAEAHKLSFNQARAIVDQFKDISSLLFDGVHDPDPDTFCSNCHEKTTS